MTKKYTREEVECFLNKEHLGLQKIDLPFGLSTPGHPRHQIKRALLSEDLPGRSVLDVGSGLGQMCIFAQQNGAVRAVGLELDRDRLRQAKIISEILQISPQPEYRREDIDDSELAEDFDIVLMLDVIHHLRDPIGVIRKLAEHTRHRLIIEVASPSSKDARKQRFGLMFRMLLSNYPAAYVGPGHPKASQTYFFTAQALYAVLSSHDMSFWRINQYPSEIKGRYILDCRKISIDRMILVAGCNSAGKSTFCESVRRNEYSQELNYDDYSNEVFISPTQLWGKSLDNFFPDQKNSECLFHYDLSLVEKFGLHSFSRDPSTSLLKCSGVIDAVLIAPSTENLKMQIYESEIKGKSKKRHFHKRIWERFGEPGYLAGLYGDWLDFLETLDATVNLHIFGDFSEGRRLENCQSFAEARAFIYETYGAA